MSIRRPAIVFAFDFGAPPISLYQRGGPIFQLLCFPAKSPVHFLSGRKLCRAIILLLGSGWGQTSANTTTLLVFFLCPIFISFLSIKSLTQALLFEALLLVNLTQGRIWGNSNSLWLLPPYPFLPYCPKEQITLGIIEKISCLCWDLFWPF